MKQWCNLPWDGLAPTDVILAVTPDVAAGSLVDFIETFDITRTGEYWAPRGPRDIGTAEAVLGNKLPTPLHLPW